MEILIGGDSLTAGIVGCDFTGMLAAQEQGLEIVNLGVGGDTLQGIHRRIARYLESPNQIKAVILEAGHNDILLTAYRSLDWQRRVTAWYMRLRGSAPYSKPEVFETQYHIAVREIQHLTNAPVILTTLSCLSEDLNADLNRTRKFYNDAIRRVAAAQGCWLADIGQHFDQQLGAPSVEFSQKNLLLTLVLDILRTRSCRGAASLSRQRGLRLTIDGVHLNERGAQIYCDVLRKALREAGVL